MAKVTLPKLKAKKGKERFAMVTCYDYTFAKLVEKSGIETILVGDSLGMVIGGYSTTLNVEVEQVAYHVRAVRKGAPSPFLVADLPFGSYQASVERGVDSAVTLLKAGAEAVKIEGGEEVCPLVKRLTSMGIPVVGHVGLTPQYVNRFGGFGKRGKTDSERHLIERSALMLQDAGADIVLLEGVPSALGKSVTESLSVPTIGIGAGPGTDAQVLVIYDLLGMDDSFYPGFLKKYLNLDNTITDALSTYRSEVVDGIFPEK